jgi:hypothetical protein
VAIDKDVNGADATAARRAEVAPDDGAVVHPCERARVVTGGDVREE